MLRIIKKNILLKIIQKYQNHPSNKLLKAKNKNRSQTFSFRETNTDEIKTNQKSFQNIDPEKGSQKRVYY